MQAAIRRPHSQAGWARTGEIMDTALTAYGTPNAEGTVADSAAAERFPPIRAVSWPRGSIPAGWSDRA
jgi:hypothetical protein